MRNYANENITPQVLLASGYKRFENKNGNYKVGYQKKVTDERGIKYHITFHEYDFTEYKEMGLPYFAALDCHIQFETQVGTIDFTFHCRIVDLAALEAHIEKLWEFHGKSYYELM